jgi:hypothetical protein
MLREKKLRGYLYSMNVGQNSSNLVFLAKIRLLEFTDDGWMVVHLRFLLSITVPVQTKLSAVITIRAVSLNIHASIPASRMWWSKAAEVGHAMILTEKWRALYCSLCRHHH